MSLSRIGISLAEQGILPDFMIRSGIRKLCARRIESCVPIGTRAKADARARFADKMRQGPLAPVPEAANEQHYEVPESFFGHALGHRRKYSGCYWSVGCADLNAAEDESLKITCERAEIEDGMSILELGCGWGSLTLWMAEHYRNTRITAVSNSNSQREYIESLANEKGLSNITVITCDMNDLQIDARFDRIVSVEMFEHMRNYELLLSRVSSWLKPEGKLFVHIFAHKNSAYEFLAEGSDNWMGRYFFTGGIMPAQQLFHEFDTDMQVHREWVWDGSHYQKTADAWLANLDKNKELVIKLFSTTMPAAEAKRMYNRWRIFFLACAETFGYDNGNEWLVGHYLLYPVFCANDTNQLEHEATGATV